MKLVLVIILFLAAVRAQIDELRSRSYTWTDHGSGTTSGPWVFQPDGAFFYDGEHRGRYQQTSASTFDLWWTVHPSAPKGVANSVPFTYQSNGEWTMPLGSRVTLERAERAV